MSYEYALVIYILRVLEQGAKVSPYSFILPNRGSKLCVQILNCYYKLFSNIKWLCNLTPIKLIDNGSLSLTVYVFDNNEV